MTVVLLRLATDDNDFSSPNKEKDRFNANDDDDNNSSSASKFVAFLFCLVFMGIMLTFMNRLYESSRIFLLLFLLMASINIFFIFGMFTSYILRTLLSSLSSSFHFSLDKYSFWGFILNFNILCVVGMFLGMARPGYKEEDGDNDHNQNEMITYPPHKTIPGFRNGSFHCPSRLWPSFARGNSVMVVVVLPVGPCWWLWFSMTSRSGVGHLPRFVPITITTRLDLSSRTTRER